MEFQTRSVGERLVRFIYATPHWRDVGYVGADDKATTSDAASPGMCGCGADRLLFNLPVGDDLRSRKRTASSVLKRDPEPIGKIFASDPVLSIRVQRHATSPPSPLAAGIRTLTARLPPLRACIVLCSTTGRSST